jgi:hypothetical protein
MRSGEAAKRSDEFFYIYIIEDRYTWMSSAITNAIINVSDLNIASNNGEFTDEDYLKKLRSIMKIV